MHSFLQKFHFSKAVVPNSLPAQKCLELVFRFGTSFHFAVFVEFFHNFFFDLIVFTSQIIQ